MEKMKEKGKKKEPLRNSYELDLLTIFFRIGLDFFSDSAIIRIQNPYSRPQPYGAAERFVKK